MLHHKSDIRRRSLPTVEIFWSVCDDRLPIVELLEWPVIKNFYEVRIFVLIISQYVRKQNVCVINIFVPSTFICRNTLKAMKSKQKSTP